MSTLWASRIWDDLCAIRQRRPLVHNITNMVVMNETANVLLAVGASPVMAHAPNEVEDMAQYAGALVLNIGTLDDAQVASMLIAGRAANRLDIPVVLDPVGAGATPLRTDAARRILDEVRVTLIRANAAEALAVAGRTADISGVDSRNDSLELRTVIESVARELSVTMAVTGAVDVVTDGVRACLVHNGHPLLTRVTGTGCSVTTVAAAFLAVRKDAVAAAAEALAYFGLCGERAADGCKGPSSFEIALRDWLYAITEADLDKGVRVEEIAAVSAVDRV